MQTDAINEKPDDFDEHKRLFEAWMEVNGKKGNSILISEEKSLGKYHPILQAPKPKPKDPKDKRYFKYHTHYSFFELGPEEYLYLKMDESKFKTGCSIMINIEKHISVMTCEGVFGVLSNIHRELLYGRRTNRSI
jgi:hypothetical protein